MTEPDHDLVAASEIEMIAPPWNHFPHCPDCHKRLWRADEGPGIPTSIPEHNCSTSEPGEYILYRHWDKNGQLLYAGRTNNPPARLTQHRSKAAWWAEVSWTTYEKFPSLEALKAGEAWAIKHENPQWNIQGREHPGQPRKSQDPGTDRYRPITTRDLAPDIKLVHPLSREFSVYGTDAIVRRAREWALAHHYYLLDSGPACAHALYRMRCPTWGNCLPGADHTQVWVPAPDFSTFDKASGAEEPFILTQPYAGSLNLGAGEKVPALMVAYAAAHGLDINTYIFDTWYLPEACVAIRFQADPHNVAWPLATEALSLMCAWRDDWPETVPEWLA